MKYFTLRILQELPLARAWEFFARSYRAHRDTRHLATFNDHLLRDIGVTRDEIRPDRRF